MSSVVFLYYRIRCKYPLFDLLTPHNKFIFLLCNSDPYVNSCVGVFIYSDFAVKKLSMCSFLSCTHLRIHPTCVFLFPILAYMYTTCLVL